MSLFIQRFLRYLYFGYIIYFINFYPKKTHVFTKNTNKISIIVKKLTTPCNLIYIEILSKTLKRKKQQTLQKIIALIEK